MIVKRRHIAMARAAMRAIFFGYWASDAQVSVDRWHRAANHKGPKS